METFIAIKHHSSHKGATVHTEQIGKNLFQVELETGGLKNLICSYIINSQKPMLVESGPTNSVPKLILGIKELGINPTDIEYVAITHVHLDHGGGAGTLLRFLPNAKVIVHPRGMPHLFDPERLWPSSQAVLGFISDIFGKPEPVPKDHVIPVSEGVFDLGEGGKLTVMETLGHASHNLSFHESFNNGVFPGDAAGTYIPEFDVVVPTTPPPFRLDVALASIDKIMSLKPTALYYSHFGKASDTMRRLKDYKVQLQLWADVAEEGVKKGLTLQQISDKIVAADQVMSEHAVFFKSHPIYKTTVLENCVKGFIGYAQQKLGKQNSNIL
jgi:glyoxylase-like metal-dependent hydrolase (beta-lactamase superfamily II)